MRPFILALVLMLGGCAALAPHFEAKPNPHTTAGYQCPPLKSYTPAQQQEAARELDSLPADAVLPMFMDDYHLMREMCR